MIRGGLRYSCKLRGEEMYIKEIIQFCKENREADMCISDGVYSVMCYAYPIDEIAVNKKVNTLYGFMCSEIIKSSSNICCVKKLAKYYAYSITAKVVSIDCSIVQIGDLQINLDTYIPNDIMEGDYVSFSVARLDL